MEMPKQYDAKEAEPKWQAFWDKEGLHVVEPSSDIPTIDTPPPTLSGRMHIGHASSYSQQDFYARFFRMRYGKVFFPFGTDDNGLATERLVERQKGVKSTKMSRKDFRDLCHKTIEEMRPDFVEDWIRIGVSADYKNAYSTISRECQAASQRSFIDLFKKQRVYEQESPVSWCVTCQTAIAQAEFESVEMKSSFNDIRFRSEGKDLIISTTRPELLPACVCLAAHPSDERYKGLEGKFASVPLFDYEVPIKLDESVDVSKGTGLMMVCTFGDKDDVEKWHKHNLPLRAIFTKNGKLNELAGKYEGMTIKEARKQILSDLESEGNLLSKNPISHPVNVHERCGTEIEFIKSKQWYVRVLDIKEDLIEAGRKIKWHPKFMQKRYEHWVENLNWDWCISRQRHFGIPFPVWHDKKTGEVHVADYDQLPVDPIQDKPASVPKERWDDLEPNTDVMDTWATSSLSPQIVLGWHDDPVKAQDLLPMTLRPQAHDIIRTWAFYTIVKSHLHNDKIPWENMAISGFVTDPHGRKMSKSKGNIVDPRQVIERFSADTIRYWAAGAKLGDDIPYQEKDLVTGHKTVNKLWNASKLVMMNLEGFSGYNAAFEELEIMDRWMLSRSSALVASVSKSFKNYDHSKAKFDLEQFFWNEFCDNYLEIVKGRLYEPKDDLQRASAQYVLLHVLEDILKMFAPFMPHITEEIYSYLPVENKSVSVHISSWPEAREEWRDADVERVGDEIVKVISEVRKFKSQNQMSMKAPIKKLVVRTKLDLTLAANDLMSVTKAEDFSHEQGDFEVIME